MIQTKRKKYKETDKMRHLIADNSQLLMTLSRFGIPLGFGDSTVEEVCSSHAINVPTFLAVANFMSGYEMDGTNVDAGSLMTYLVNAHDYFLDFQLPMIRRKLIESVDISDPEGLGFLILRFFDEYTLEVRRHMDMENRKVFPYVRTLIEGKDFDNMSFKIKDFSQHHESIAPKMKELKDLIIRYYSGRGTDMLNSALFDIITCENDLRMHCEVEDSLFVDVVSRLEALRVTSSIQNICKDEAEENETDSTDVEKIASLSEREKEIIVNIAKGLSNKEIADKLCLSVHTVTTHRRNISSKLDIHSPAGLTIFAIVNGLIPLGEIPRPR